MEVAVQEVPDGKADEAAGRQRQDELEDRLRLANAAKRAVLLRGLIVVVVGHDLDHYNMQGSIY